MGASRFLRGLVRVVAPANVSTVVNTGDDREFYGVHVAPDLDIVTYALAGAVDSARGYGLAGDTFALIEYLEQAGHDTWFRLGDRDFAHCLDRTLQLRAGAGLGQCADQLRRRLGVATEILPMTEDPAPTLVAMQDGRVLHFEEYLVRERAPDGVASVDLRAASGAAPFPAALEAIAGAQTLLVCPSNPVVSIGPILAVPGVRDAIAANPNPVVAISPIIGGKPVKGPADRLLRAIGSEVSARGVAKLYRGLVQGMVIDRVDADQVSEIEALGIRCRAVDTLMRTPEIAAQVAKTALDLVASLR